MRFFLDNNLSVKLARGLATLSDDEVIHLRDKFPPDSPDTEWLRFIGENGYLLVSRDRKIRFHPAERRALIQYRVGAFFLSGKDLDSWDLVEQVVRNWRRMKEYAEEQSKPFIYNIPPNGTKFTRIPVS
jgi:predicted nuclease of predicted toxin-antitoxin system